MHDSIFCRKIFKVIAGIDSRLHQPETCRSENFEVEMFQCKDFFVDVGKPRIRAVLQYAPVHSQSAVQSGQHFVCMPFPCIIILIPAHIAAEFLVTPSHESFSTNRTVSLHIASSTSTKISNADIEKKEGGTRILGI